MQPAEPIAVVQHDTLAGSSCPEGSFPDSNKQLSTQAELQPNKSESTSGLCGRRGRVPAAALHIPTWRCSLWASSKVTREQRSVSNTGPCSATCKAIRAGHPFFPSSEQFNARLRILIYIKGHNRGLSQVQLRCEKSKVLGVNLRDNSVSTSCMVCTGQPQQTPGERRTTVRYKKYDFLNPIF